MATTEKYQIDIFSIMTMIVSVLTIIFLIIAAVYYGNLVSGKPPSNAESSFLLWSSVVLIIILAALAIFATIKVFKHKSYVVDDRPVMVNVNTPHAHVDTITHGTTVSGAHVDTITHNAPVSITQPTTTFNTIPVTPRYYTTPMNSYNPPSTVGASAGVTVSTLG